MWLQLMELVPMNLAERSKWKVSPRNLLPLQYSLHLDLTDGTARRALLRPTRADLHDLVRALEAGLTQEEKMLSTAIVSGHNVSGWRPDWNTIIKDNWSRKVNAGSSEWLSFEYQIDFFNLREGAIITTKGDSGLRYLKEAPGIRQYPNCLERELESVYAPLSVLLVIAIAVSQMHWVSRAVPAHSFYQQTFVDDLDTMSYVVNLVGSLSPSDFRSLKRPSVLPFDRPVVKGLALPSVVREWPRRSRLRSSSTTGSNFVFSSSPPEDYDTKWASELQGLKVEPEEAIDMPETSDNGDESDDNRSGGAGGAGEGHRGAPGESPSTSEESSSGTMSPMSQGFGDTSRQREHREGGDSPPSEHGNLPSTLKRSSLKTDINRTELGPRETSHEDLRHEEWELLDDEQDELLNTAREALIQRLQALAMPTRPYCAKASTLMSTFLVGSDPLAIATKLDDIERRRREIIDEWE